MSLRKREYCFTLNNWTQAHKDLLNLDNMKALYIVYGEEVGAEGTPHLQGYIYFPTLKSMQQVQDLCPNLHLEVPINKKQSIAYCMKGEQTKEEWDEHKQKGPNYGLNAKVTELGEKPKQGKRTDLHYFIDSVESGVRNRKRLRYEHPSVTAKYPRWTEQILDDNAVLECPEITLYPWQQQLVDLFKTKPDNRTIHWYWSEEGLVGKSTFCTYIYLTLEDVHVVEPMEYKDLAESINTDTKILLMDCPRDTDQREFPYRFLEKCKDRRIFSQKYNSTTKWFNPFHVVIFANFAPDASKYSPDRLHVVKLVNMPQ